MRIAEALRGLLDGTNDKAYRSQNDQDRVTEAQRALEEWDASSAPEAAPAAGSSVADATREEGWLW